MDHQNPRLNILLLQTRKPPGKYASAKIDLISLKEAVFLPTALSVVMAEVGLIIPIIYLPSYALFHDVDTDFPYHILCQYSTQRQ